MNKAKKVLTYALGATMIAGATAYLAMPASTKQKIKNMFSDMTKKMSSDSTTSMTK